MFFLSYLPPLYDELEKEKLRSLARMFNRHNVSRMWGDFSSLQNLAWEKAWLSIPTLRSAPTIARTLCCQTSHPPTSATPSTISTTRNAATNDFRKLYRRVEHVEEAEGLPGLGHGLPGNQTYRLRIGYNYPVKSFRGRKTVILSQTSWQVNLTLTRNRKT